MTNEEARNELIKILSAKNHELEAALKREKKEHEDDVEFLKNVIVSLMVKENVRRVAYEEYPKAKFEICENLSGEPVIILKKLGILI